MTCRRRGELDHGGFTRRYATREGDGATAGPDGLSGSEGAFLACSLWPADARAAIGRPDAARDLFARVVALGNDVGLLSEEWDPAGLRQLGNTPQAFTHVAFVDTGFTLAATR